MYKQLEENNLLPIEHKGCQKGSYGCKDQLLINKVIIEEVKTRKKNLTTAWIDYKKAFDFVPHDWILKCLDIYKILPILIQFLTASMDQWKTTLLLNHADGTLHSRQVNINNGVFQDDSLSLSSPLLHGPYSTILSPE